MSLPDPTPSLAPIPVLLFSATSGYRHTSIPASISSLQRLASTCHAFTLTASEDASLFTPSNLSQYKVIILLQTIGPIFSPSQLSALKNFVHGGGGVVAVHAAAAGMPDDQWYGKLIGAHFDQHPPHEPGTVLPEEANQTHPIMKCCGGKEGWLDEWYNFTSHPRENKNLTVLLRGDPESFAGGNHGKDHPLTWCQEFEGGRVWFTALGHFEEAYEDEWFMAQVRRGIIWAAGEEAKGEWGWCGLPW